MDKSKFFTATVLVASLSIPTVGHAALVSQDWQTTGDELVTFDTDTGLEWLDVNLSISRSFNDVSSQFGVGGDYEGFRYATVSDFNALFDHVVQIAGNDSSLTKDDIYSVGSDVDIYIEMLGTTGDAIGYPDVISGIIPVSHLDYLSQVAVYEVEGSQQFGGPRFTGGTTYMSTAHPYVGSWLVRDVTVVPLPAAIWLFSFGLLSLVGLARKKANA